MKSLAVLLTVLSGVLSAQNLMEYLDDPITQTVNPAATMINAQDGAIFVYATKMMDQVVASGEPTVTTTTSDVVVTSNGSVYTTQSTITITTSNLPVRIMYGAATNMKAEMTLGCAIFVGALFWIFA